jgi:outer membrane murein-binding lipoprotein Lpp
VVVAKAVRVQISLTAYNLWNKVKNMAVQRWNDEMLDELATTVSNMAAKVDVLTDKVDVLTDKVDVLTDKVDVLTEKVEDLTEQGQILMLALNRLTETAIDYSRWKQETDQRFNVLLEEVRATNRRVTVLEDRN